MKFLVWFILFMVVETIAVFLASCCSTAGSGKAGNPRAILGEVWLFLFRRIKPIREAIRRIPRRLRGRSRREEPLTVQEVLENMPVYVSEARGRVRRAVGRTTIFVQRLRSRPVAERVK